MTNSKSRDPETPEEWQAAVDAADFALLLDSAIQYGLVEFVGQPSQVDQDRCFDILDRGAQLGYYPTPADRRRVWIGWYVKDQRQRHGWTQRTLAQKIGSSQGWVSCVEREKANCSDATIAILRAVFSKPA